MNNFFTFLTCCFLAANSPLFAQYGPCSPFSLSVPTSYAPGTYTLQEVVSGYIPLPNCDRESVPKNATGNLEPGYWFSFTAPASGKVSLKMENVSVVGEDMGLAIFYKTGGTCPSTLNLAQLICIPNGNGYMPAQNDINVSQHIGKTLYIRVWKYGKSSYTFGKFKIGLWAAPPCSKPLTPTISGTLKACDQTTLSVAAPESGVNYTWSNGEVGKSIAVSNSGLYQVTAERPNCGMAISASVSVSIENAPDAVEIEGSSEGVCANSSQPLNAKSDCSDCSFVWSNGKTGKSVTVTASASPITVTVKNKCGQQTSDPFSFNLVEKPEVPTIMGAQDLCPNGGELELSIANEQSGVTYRWSTGELGASIMAKTKGTYRVTATDQTCPTLQTISAAHVVSLAVLTKPIVTRKSNVFTLSNAFAFSEIQWYLDGVEVDGETSDTFTASSQGSVSVEVTDAKDCVQMSSVLQTVAAQDWTESKSQSDDFRLFPNPSTTGRCQLQLAFVEENSTYYVEVFNTLGQRVWSKRFEEHATNALLDLPFVAPINGEYWVKVQGDKATVVKRLLVLGERF